VKPGFDEAGRCPIHESTVQIYQGRGPAGETRFEKQDDVLQKYEQQSKISTARCRYQSTLSLKKPMNWNHEPERSRCNL